MMTTYAKAAGSSSIITLAIIYAMQALIAMQPAALVDLRTPHFLSPFLPPRVEEPPIVDVPPTRLIHPITPPTTLIENPDPGPNVTIGVPLPNPLPPPPPGRTVGFALSDGPLINIVRVQPAYPARAVQLAMEGYVVVAFDVAENGQTTNAVVVESSHRIFEKAALTATGRLRYKPQVVDGTPVATTGVRYRFKFEMEK